jgi:hypothetical protein
MSDSLPYNHASHPGDDFSASGGSVQLDERNPSRFSVLEHPVSGRLAQSVERRSYKPEVAGSCPAPPTILLTQGYSVIVNDEGFERFGHLKWCSAVQRNKGFRVYAKRGVLRPDGTVETIFLHRAIMDAKPGQRVDHINRNTLDCRRENLRFADYFQNACNRVRNSPPPFGFIGVESQTPGSYRGAETISRRRHYTKTFKSPALAAAARDALARELHGEFCVLNF